MLEYITDYVQKRCRRVVQSSRWNLDQSGIFPLTKEYFFVQENSIFSHPQKESRKNTKINDNVDSVLGYRTNDNMPWIRNDKKNFWEIFDNFKKENLFIDAEEEEEKKRKEKKNLKLRVKVKCRCSFTIQSIIDYLNNDPSRDKFDSIENDGGIWPIIDFSNHDLN
ncbi:LOW QUALITY PROTEIN: myb-like protein X [Vespula squamosa]|uniref:Myb-like protein X n=1 Tax=Vespula squamosa TaxID=30214 RepID=A0ABD1ZUJ8_VESSQ